MWLEVWYRKYRRNSIENDYCSGKIGFIVVSPLGLVGSVGLRLGLVTSSGLWLRVRVSVNISGVIVAAFTATKASCIYHIT